MKPRMFLTIMGLMLVLFCYSSAQVPQLINYQGKLTKASGAPVDTTISMVFTVYADSNGITSKWSESQSSVKVEKGIFNVLLGSTTAIPDSVFDGSIRYLGVKVGGDPEITPRKPMVSVAYAYRSFKADTAGFALAGAGDNDWTMVGDTIYHLNGNVGIGTTTPGEKLHVLNGNIRIGSTLTGNSIKFYPASFGTETYVGEILASGGAGYMQWLTKPGSNILLSPGGNVGIGTSNPQRALHISDVLRIEPRASAPSSPSEGDIYVNSTDHHMYCYLNGVWKQLDN